MLVGPKCGAHIPCGPSFDGPDCASAHDRRHRISGGQQRGCEGPASRAGLAHSLHLAAAGRAGLVYLQNILQNINNINFICI